MQRKYFSNIEKLANGFASFAAEILSDTLAKRETASLVVPGGNTPRFYLPALADQPLPWHRISITLSDERWVDTGSNESNEHLVRENFLAHLSENANFVGLKTLHSSPAAAVPDIHQRLQLIPQPFTLTVLGLGEDGHIASLFPGMRLNESIAKTTEHCIAVNPPIAPSPRVSLSLTTLAESEQIVLVVTGKPKQELLDRLTEKPDPGIPLVWLLRQSQSPVTIFETDAP